MSAAGFNKIVAAVSRRGAQRTVSPLRAKATTAVFARLVNAADAAAQRTGSEAVIGGCRITGDLPPTSEVTSEDPAWQEDAKIVLTPVAGEASRTATLSMSQFRDGGFSSFIPAGFRRQVKAQIALVRGVDYPDLLSQYESFENTPEDGGVATDSNRLTDDERQGAAKIVAAPSGVS